MMGGTKGNNLATVTFARGGGFRLSLSLSLSHSRGVSAGR